ncbi:1-acylglycerol-3-phosphate O-acyltransferase [Yamadazyma tenuis]|uniref:1-acyl-sn-glycerol-3-phosphate acyltransferase n=1 Tax=Candida tenuis (strain ATCC 10573 / BCRC 21748 / CBS 615 / JCM 9827 / NBRC 10315 / NRRL Y-1498 / VKM Y-70) TaxID=590646 RepID=G3AW68_CANTC|nr:1-acylglycerol-3-phosphate O [Yamadazyma tenuis ATCC 10573]EGV66466.1 1-acylglycerol-3-phosphate O [Yamadazyma tenuis ATCC 10573]WEJ95416.1 1-acylglycerol-3-phosphate O-acyltransferase [Yamadazyma tenuis]
MASFFQTIKFYVKSTIFGLLILVCAFYGVVASIFLRVIGKPEYSQYTVARAFYYSFSTILGVKIKVNNAKNLSSLPGIFISNHQSALDIFILGKIFQPGFTVTAKKVLKYVPFLGWFMLASGTFFIDRAKSDKARKVLDEALAALKKEKRGVFMFPEGTRSASTNLEMLPFKKGAFHLANQAKIPVVPIVVSNTSTIFHAKSKIFNCGEIIIDVLPAVETKDIETKEQLDEMVVQVRSSMLEKLKEIGFSKTAATVIPPKSPAKLTPEPINSKSTDEVSETVEIDVSTEESPLVAKG